MSLDAFIHVSRHVADVDMQKAFIAYESAVTARRGVKAQLFPAHNRGSVRCPLLVYRSNIADHPYSQSKIGLGGTALSCFT